MRRVAALVVLLLAGCKPADQAVSIPFRAVADGSPLSCTAGANGKTLNDLRFYVHDVALLTADGHAVSVTLDAAPPWQSKDIALLDLEDGQGTCDTGSPDRHAALTGRVPAGHYVGLRFTLGVPFALNHADPTTATAPLDQTVMHWHWRAGYKFLRAGIAQAGNIAWLHLGSTGCEGTIGAITGCAQPNRPTVTLAAFNPAKDAVAVDLGVLFADVTGDGNRSCQSQTDNALCAPMLRHLGVAGAGQDVFRAMVR
jgi:uncharacterized repeat protein (TIGR04052 family)